MTNDSVHINFNNNLSNELRRSGADAWQVDIFWREDGKRAGVEHDEVSLSCEKRHVTVRIVRLLDSHPFNVRHADPFCTASQILNVAISSMGFPATLFHRFGVVVLDQREQPLAVQIL